MIQRIKRSRMIDSSATFLGVDCYAPRACRRLLQQNRQLADAEKDPNDKIELEAGIKGWERHLEPINYILTRVSLE
jgi:hypothetical protein